MQNEKINPEQAFQTLVIIWFALFMSQFLFLGLVFFVKPELMRFDLTRPLLGENSIVVLLLAAISLVDLGISFVLRRKNLDRAVAEQNVAHVQTAMITGCALSEAISLFGLLLAFSFDYPYFYLFLALGLLGIILHFPRRSLVHAASYKV